MNVLVTGSNGFIGKNLIIRLNELNIKVLTFTRENSKQDLKEFIKNTNCIVHLAGENRPKDEKDFGDVNAGLTISICDNLRSLGMKIPIILASSIQAELDNPYGKSKLNAEHAVKSLEIDTGCNVYIYRLPGVFGKWSKPHYNSVVATFCHDISHDLPIHVNDPSFELNLVYIDDVVNSIINSILIPINDKNINVASGNAISILELINILTSFNNRPHEIQKINSSSTYHDLIFDNSLLLNNLIKKENDLKQGLKIEYEYMKKKYENNI